MTPFFGQVSRKPQGHNKRTCQPRMLKVLV